MTYARGTPLLRRRPLARHRNPAPNRRRRHARRSESRGRAAPRPAVRANQSNLGIRDRPARRPFAGGLLDLTRIGDLVERRKRDPAQDLVQGHRRRPARLRARRRRHLAQVQRLKGNLGQREEAVEPRARGRRKVIPVEIRGDGILRIEKRLLPAPPFSRSKFFWPPVDPHLRPHVSDYEGGSEAGPTSKLVGRGRDRNHAAHECIAGAGCGFPASLADARPGPLCGPPGAADVSHR